MGIIYPSSSYVVFTRRVSTSGDVLSFVSMACTCCECSRSLPSADVDPHLECLSCQEVVCTFDNNCDRCVSLSHNVKIQFECRKGSASGAMFPYLLVILIRECVGQRRL